VVGGLRGFSDYDFSLDWNSPHNLRALSSGWGGAFYRVEGGISWAEGVDGAATILAIGEGDKWPSKAPLRTYVVTNGNDRFLLVEHPASEIHWMEPKY
jgi:hypothetical protein